MRYGFQVRTVATDHHRVAAQRHVDIHAVTYVNFNAEYRMEKARFCKRKSFEHERELRLVVTNDLERGISDGTQDGKSVDVNLETLIDRVNLSPEAPSWLVGVVENQLERYEIRQKAVRQSNLYDQDQELA